MADDTRETEKPSALADGNTISDGSKYPKGIVLGPDGKPYVSPLLPFSNPF